MIRLSTVLLAFLLVIAACSKDPLAEPENAALLQVPYRFPVPDFPADNEFSEVRWTLGKKLFFDPAMSRDSSISCASCHHPGSAFSDTVKFSFGVDSALGIRNVPSLANVAYHPYFMREGGAATLEMQVLVPIQEHHEFDFNILLIAERMQEDSSYRRLSMEAYNRVPDPFVITRALATFERSFISGNSPYDSFYYKGNMDAISAEAIRGFVLFNSDKASCSECHGGFNFTGYAFKNNGLYKEYADPGRFKLTGLEEDRALFKTPSLRNVAVTAPYMHDGSFKSLEEVVEHYNSGGQGHPNQDPLVRPLGLTVEERAELVAFLRSLTDEEFINDPRFQN